MGNPVIESFDKKSIANSAIEAGARIRRRIRSLTKRQKAAAIWQYSVDEAEGVRLIS
jgi:hypothetical protein